MYAPRYVDTVDAALSWTRMYGKAWASCLSSGSLNILTDNSGGKVNSCARGWATATK